MASTAPDQDAVGVQVSLSQMLDLALGTPEVGVVNLNILHNFLHVLLHQINLKDTTVEYRGEDAARIQTMVESLKTGPSLHLQEYNITDGAGNVFQRQPVPRTIADGITPTALGFKRLEDTVVQLQQQFHVLEELATTPEMVERIKAIRTDPLTDMWHVININKRLDAAEQGITKITEMMQDLIKGDKVQVVGTDNTKQVGRINDRLLEVEANLAYIAQDISNLRETYQSVPLPEEIPASSVRAVPVSTDSPAAIPDQPSTTTATHSEQVSAASEKVPSTAEQTPDALSPADKVAPAAQPPTAVTKSPSPDTTQKISAVTARQPVIGGEELNAVRNNIAELKGELTQTKHDLGQLSNRVNKLETTAGPSIQGISPNGSRSPYIPTAADVSRVGRLPVNQNSVSSPDTPEIHNPIQDEVIPLSDVATPEMGLNVKDTSKAGDGLRPPSISLTSSQDSNKQQSSVPQNTLHQNAVQQSISHQGTAQQTRVHHQGVRVSSDDPDKIRMMEALRNIEIMYGEAITNLDARVQDLENEMKIMYGRINTVPCSSEGFQEIHELTVKVQRIQTDIENLKQLAGRQMPLASEECPYEQVGSDCIQEIQQLIEKIKKIQSDIEHINETAVRLAEEKSNRDTATKALMEQIELLKTVKADKEDLEDALADKADAQVVKRKVSYDHFDTTCYDLARGLEDAVTKLNQQEATWQQALDEVQREIEGKLDKIEIGPIKDFINNRLKMLQSKLKQLAEERRENEAAGTKKMLSDVQCISCDKNVVMKMEEGTSYRSDPMPCSRSIKPYLTYELDQVRKQQKKLPGRSMIQFNAAVQEMGKRSKLPRDDTNDRVPRDNLCNRYCGGSHTITTAHQRVMRMGHFLAQWGPEAIQLTDGLVKGTDGQFYRGRPVPPASSSGKTEVSSPRAQGESQVERPLTPTSQAQKVLSPQKSQLTQKRSSSVTQAVSKRSVRKNSESVKEVQPSEPIVEEPLPSPTTDVTDVNEVQGNVSPVNLVNEEDHAQHEME